MIRDTSIHAFEEIRDEGLLSKRRFQAYEALYNFGPATAMELCRHVRINGLWKRLSELKAQGLAREIGEKTCAVTGRNAIEWDVTSNLPAESTPAVKRQPCSRCAGSGHEPTPTVLS